jgi:hypothetical protein
MEIQKTGALPGMIPMGKSGDLRITKKGKPTIKWR